MNKLVKRGFSAYVVFIKNKVASSIMMLFSGVMMFVAAINNHGNDTKSLPTLVTVVGVVLTLWTVYRLGYIKSNFDKISKENDQERSDGKKAIFFQILEALMYAIVAGIGIFLLVNESLMNKVFDLMAGGFTTLNGVLSAIYIYKHKEEKDFRWKMGLVLMVVEFVLGPYFLFVSGSIDIPGYIVMGALTSVAGLVEVISALTRENIKCTIDDGKKIINIIKADEDKNTQIKQ